VTGVGVWGLAPATIAIAAAVVNWRTASRSIVRLALWGPAPSAKRKIQNFEIDGFLLEIKVQYFLIFQTYCYSWKVEISAYLYLLSLYSGDLPRSSGILLFSFSIKSNILNLSLSSSESLLYLSSGVLRRSSGDLLRSTGDFLLGSAGDLLLESTGERLHSIGDLLLSPGRSSGERRLLSSKDLSILVSLLSSGDLLLSILAGDRFLLSSGDFLLSSGDFLLTSGDLFL
jgi:hypothetical protein